MAQDAPTTKTEEIAALALRTAASRGRKASTLENKRNAWEAKIVPAFRSRVAAQVTHEEAQQAARDWAGTWGPHASLKAVREAAHGWRLALHRGWVGRTPWVGVVVPGAVRHEQRVMPADARRTLRAYLEPVGLGGLWSPMRRVTALALLLLAEVPAGRMAETAGLRWSGVDFRRRRITWTEHKTDQRVGAKHTVMTPYAERVLTVARAVTVSGPWVFPGPSGDRPAHDLTKSMARACRRAGVGHYTPHDLRRGIAQEARDAGASLEDIQAMLGHESRSTTERYLGWSAVQAARALRLVEVGS